MRVIAKANDKLDRALDSAGAHLDGRNDWLDLAALAVDQAGCCVADYERIKRILDKLKFDDGE